MPGHLDEVPGAIPLRELAPLARERGIPVLVDAAFLNYPPESMRRFTDAGADLVCFSAKYFYGPNGGGFVVGRADLVGAVEAVDFTGYESGRWLVFGRVRSSSTCTRWSARRSRSSEWLEPTMERAELVRRAGRRARRSRRRASRISAEPRFFTMEETLEDARQLPGRPRGSAEAGTSAADVERALDDGNPRIAVHRWDDTLIVAVDTMLPEQCAYVCERLRAALM